MARSKASGNRAYHREDMQKVNKTALIIGGISAVLILIAIVMSFLF